MDDVFSITQDKKREGDFLFANARYFYIEYDQISVHNQVDDVAFNLSVMKKPQIVTRKHWVCWKIAAGQANDY